jgi:hypothetical protein
MTSMKLQKLVYCTQAWALASLDRPAFDADIQAWANGPVVYELFDRHRGRFVVGPNDLGQVQAIEPAVAGRARGRARAVRPHERPAVERPHAQRGAFALV